jgi:hypothetical protein
LLAVVDNEGVELERRVTVGTFRHQPWIVPSFGIMFATMGRATNFWFGFYFFYGLENQAWYYKPIVA